MTFGRSAGTKVCDDCGIEYAGPAYYTFSSKDCMTADHDGPARRHVGCTGNLCARCTGSDLEPDQPDDPRRVSRRRPLHVKIKGRYFDA